MNSSLVTISAKSSAQTAQMTAREAHLWLGLILASELGNDLVTALLGHKIRFPLQKTEYALQKVLYII
jgi:hypothetical protein